MPACGVHRRVFALLQVLPGDSTDERRCRFGLSAYDAGLPIGMALAGELPAVALGSGSYRVKAVLECLGCLVMRAAATSLFPRQSSPDLRGDVSGYVRLDAGCRAARQGR